jgi:hypothetical protein
MSLKVECSDPSTMVDRVWVDGWRVHWVWAEVWGKPLSGWRCWLCRLDGIIRVVLGLRPRWVPMLGSNSQRLFDPKH